MVLLFAAKVFGVAGLAQSTIRTVCPTYVHAVCHKALRWRLFNRRAILPKRKAIVRSVRLDVDLSARLESAAREHGFSSTSAFIRELIKNGVSGRETAAEAAEQRIAAAIDRVISEIGKVRRVQHAAFAFADAQVKMLLTCVAEPPKEVYDQALARGRLRYDRFLKSVGMGLAGDSATAMKELLSRAEEE